MSDDYEFIYVTVHYGCQHAMLRPVLLHHATQRQMDGKDREVFSAEDRCPHCTAVARARLMAKMERY